MVNKKLTKKLREYEHLAAAAKATAHAQTKLRDEITKLVLESEDRDKLPEGLKIDGFGVRMISPVQNKFNKKKFVELGGNLAIYTSAHEQVPTKSYIKITVPGEIVYEEPTSEN